MRVAVIGAGGIGGLYGGLLARAGHDVSLLARGRHLQAIQQRGLRDPERAVRYVHRPAAAASDDPRDLGPADLVLFAVKTYDLDDGAPRRSRPCAPEACLLTFQNGVDAPDRVAEIVGEERVLIGTTGLETTILEPGVIGHLSPTHYVTVAALHGPPTPQVGHVVETLRGAEINASAVADGHRALWEKALILLPMATITSVCRAPIGPIRELPETQRLVDQLIDEVSAVARAYGYDLPEASARARSVISSWAYDGKASMARDFERGNRTELEALTGALVRLADAEMRRRSRRAHGLRAVETAPATRLPGRERGSEVTPLGGRILGPKGRLDAPFLAHAKTTPPSSPITRTGIGSRWRARFIGSAGSARASSTRVGRCCTTSSACRTPRRRRSTSNRSAWSPRRRAGACGPYASGVWSASVSRRKPGSQADRRLGRVIVTSG